jgi:hypothetical protein
VKKTHLRSYLKNWYSKMGPIGYGLGGEGINK